MQIKDDLSLKWPEKMKGDPSMRIKASTVISIEIMDMIQTSVTT